MTNELVKCDSNNSTSGVEQTRAFTPFGASQWIDGPLLAFTGQLWDRSTDFYLLGNGRRAYDPNLMRFTNPDQQSPFGKGGINTYAYCLGDPVNRLDPSGEVSLKKAAKMVFLIASTGKDALTGKGPAKMIKRAAKWGMIAGELLQMPHVTVDVGRGLADFSAGIALAVTAYGLGSFYYKRWVEDDAVFSPFVGPLLLETPEKSESPIVRMEGVRRELLFD